MRMALVAWRPCRRNEVSITQAEQAARVVTMLPIAYRWFTARKREFFG
jgi:hypothetical protein